MVVLLSVVAVAAGFVSFGGFTRQFVAQETFPAAEEGGLPEGVSFEVLGAGRTEEIPSNRLEVSLLRVGFEPGAALGLPEGESPSTALVYAESGSLTYRFGAPLTVNRAGAGDQEDVPVETEVYRRGWRLRNLTADRRGHHPKRRREQGRAHQCRPLAARTGRGF